MFDLKGSVLSALPPIDLSASLKEKPIILVITSMDSASFFRDKSLGAESPISVCCIPVFKLLLLGQSTFLYLYLFFLNGQGLIALLAVVDALSNVNELAGLDKQVSLCLIIYPLQIMLTGFLLLGF